MDKTENISSCRDSLLEAAKNLFAEKGYDSVSTRDLAAEAGVNLGAIRYHFGSKAALFVKAVQSLMIGAGANPFSQQLRGSSLTKEQAAEQLCLFVQWLLGFVLHPGGARPARIMIREVFSSPSQNPEMFEALISSVVDEFIRPVDASLMCVLNVLLPRGSNDELVFAAHSIVGQCLYYFTNAPFIERLRGKKFHESPEFEKTAAHISAFSLRALGCGESLIKSSIEKVFNAEKKREI